MLLATPANLQKAADHLQRDPVLAPIIARAGLAGLRPHTDYYRELVDSIISQQLSVKAAAAIQKRFVELFGGRWPQPGQLLDIDLEQLRSIGLSYAKGRYIHDLAQHILDGRLKFDRLPQQSNQEIIQELTDVKGIGEWTVHMFLMFCVGRLDVLPVGDLGIRRGLMQLYELPELPIPQQIIALAEECGWAPYQSVACWYIWHALDNKPAF